MTHPSQSYDQWQLHGFAVGIGNPIGLPSRLPAEGLWMALQERIRLCSGEPRDLGSLTGFKILDHRGRFQADFDQKLQSILPLYVNHLRSDRVEKWSWDTLAKAAAEEMGELPFIERSDAVLFPALSTKWAQQRYRMVNLLKVYRNYLMCDVRSFSGNVHNGIPTSSQQAHSAAMENGREFWSSELDVIGDRTDDIYGPSHGWEQGTYCANLEYCYEVKPQLPKGYDLGYVYVEVSADGAFDPFDTGLSIGLNRIQLDASTKGFSFDRNKIAGKRHPVPVLNVDVTYGWTGKVFVEYRPEFIFQHDCDPKKEF